MIQKRKYNLLYNLRLVVIKLKMWLPASLILLFLVIGLCIYYLNFQYSFSTGEIFFSVIGISSALFFLKSALLFMVHRLYEDIEFQGSFFVISIILSFLFLIAISSLIYVVAMRMADFPIAYLGWMLPSIFIIVVIFLFFTFHILYFLLPTFRK